MNVVPAIARTGKLLVTSRELARRSSKKLMSSLDVGHQKFDVVIVGGGIVGVASARELLCRHPNLKVAVLEKESVLAAHQTGHNSGVIHAGIYYKPGTLKAKLCVEGLHLTYKFCNEYKIPFKKVGKLIVAVDPSEEANLMELWDRGQKNGVRDLSLVDAEGIKKYEPFCKGFKALHSPHTGIVNWALVTTYFAKDFEKRGGEIFLNYKVEAFKESTADNDGGRYPISVYSNDKCVQASYVLTCGGLQSDYLSQMSGCKQEPKIIPFRGEYLLLSSKKQHLVKGNIYPVPDPRFPFLGVHFTPRMDGSVWLGPNAVVALKREGYRWRDINLSELADTLMYRGFYRIAGRYASYGFQEMIRSAFPRLQLQQLQRFIPDIEASDITRGPSGVRAQALDSAGQLVDDFVFDIAPESAGPVAGRVLHCRNAPSPGATSSLAIAKMIVDRLEKQYNL